MVLSPRSPVPATRPQTRLPIRKTLLDHIQGLETTDNPKAPLHPKLAKLAAVNASTLSRQFGEIMAQVGLVAAKNHESKSEAKARAGKRNAS